MKLTSRTHLSEVLSSPSVNMLNVKALLKRTKLYMQNEVKGLNRMKGWRFSEHKKSGVKIMGERKKGLLTHNVFFVDPILTKWRK